MQEQINDLLIKIDYLEKTINGYQQYLILTWTILAVIVGVLAFTSFFLIKSIVNERVEKELIKIKSDLKSELNNALSIEIKEIIAKESESLKTKLYSKLKRDLEMELIRYIDRTKQICWASGGNIQVPGNESQPTLNIYGLAMSSDCEKTVINAEIKSVFNGRKINCDYNEVIDKNKTTPLIKLLDYNKERDGALVTWKVIWINGKL